MGLERLFTFSSEPGWSREERECGISPQKTECDSTNVSWWDLGGWGGVAFSYVVLALPLSVKGPGGT